jgi:hypothetical protein
MSQMSWYTYQVSWRVVQACEIWQGEYTNTQTDSKMISYAYFFKM